MYMQCQLVRFIIFNATLRELPTIKTFQKKKKNYKQFQTDNELHCKLEVTSTYISTFDHKYKYMHSGAEVTHYKINR